MGGGASTVGSLVRPPVGVGGGPVIPGHVAESWATPHRQHRAGPHRPIRAAAVPGHGLAAKPPRWSHQGAFCGRVVGLKAANHGEIASPARCASAGPPIPTPARAGFHFYPGRPSTPPLVGRRRRPHRNIAAAVKLLCSPGRRPTSPGRPFNSGNGRDLIILPAAFPKCPLHVHPSLLLTWANVF